MPTHGTSNAVELSRDAGRGEDRFGIVSRSDGRCQRAERKAGDWIGCSCHQGVDDDKCSRSRCRPARNDYNYGHMKSRFEIIFAPEVSNHVKTIDKKHHSLIQQAIEGQLRFQPATETRNRKPLRQPAAFAAEWELRFGPSNHLRVLYKVDLEEKSVFVLAVGTKDRNKLFIGGQEVEL